MARSLCRLPRSWDRFSGVAYAEVSLIVRVLSAVADGCWLALVAAVAVSCCCLSRELSWVPSGVVMDEAIC